MCLKNDVHPHEGRFTEADLHHHYGMQTLPFFFFFFANAGQSSTNSHSQLLYHAELIQALMWIWTSICRPCICHTHLCFNSRAYMPLLFWAIYIKTLKNLLTQMLFKYSVVIHSKAFDFFWKAKFKTIQFHNRTKGYDLRTACFVINQGSIDGSFHKQLIVVNILFKKHTLSICSYGCISQTAGNFISIQWWPFWNNSLLETSSYRRLHYNMCLELRVKDLSPTNISFHSIILLSTLIQSAALFFTFQQANKAPFLHSLYLYLFIIFQS